VSERPGTPLSAQEPPGGSDPAIGFDRDLRVRGIVLSVGGLAVLLVACGALCWAFFRAEVRRLTALDPRPSPIAEANQPVIPPEPRLQPSPPADMAALRADQSARLGEFGWADEDASTVRIPIDRAIDLMVEKGLRPALSHGPDSDAPAGGGP